MSEIIQYKELATKSENNIDLVNQVEKITLKIMKLLQN